MKMRMNEEYYLEYFDERNRRHFTRYYSQEKEAKELKNALEDKGYSDVKIIRVLY